MFGTQWLILFPVPVLAGIIIFLGLTFLYDWLVQSAKQLPVREYLIIVGILLTIIAFDLPVGIATGVFCSLLLFIFNSSQVDVIDSVLIGEQCSSVVKRTESEQVHLLDHQHSTILMRLKSFLFFGSSRRLYDQVQRHIENGNHRLKTLILDFAQVSNIDYSAIMGLARTHRYLDGQGISLYISNVPEISQALLKRACESGTNKAVIYFETADKALEFSENNLLELSSAISNHNNGLLKLLSQAELSKAEIDIILPSFISHQFKDESYVTHTGKMERSCFIFDKGQLAIYQQRDNERIRLSVLKPGMIVGEMALYSGRPRTADIIAVGDTAVYELTNEKFKQLEQKHCDIALKIHRMFGKLLTSMLSSEAQLQKIRH